MDRALFDNAKHLAEALTGLFGKSVEVVVHDLEVEQVCYISNPISKRQVGDPANLHEIDFRDDALVLGPYEKVNWNGEIIRSVSIVLRNAEEQAKLVLCVNFDLSDLHAAQRGLASLVPMMTTLKQPEVLFKNDWHEKLNVWVTEWCVEKNLSVTSLDRKSRVALLHEIDKAGVLKERNSASYVARILNVSRATIYNDLKAIN